MDKDLITKGKVYPHWSNNLKKRIEVSYSIKLKISMSKEDGALSVRNYLSKSKMLY